MSNVKENARLHGKFSVECVDKDGNVKWTDSFPNAITDEGIDYLLDAGFDGGSADSTWFIGLIKGDGTYSAVDAGDTAAEIDGTNGWDENTDYATSNRVAWGNDAASGRSISNGTAAEFAMDATATIKGLFIVSDQAQLAITGTLWSAAEFSSDASVENGDTLKVTYTING